MLAIDSSPCSPCRCGSFFASRRGALGNGHGFQNAHLGSQKLAQALRRALVASRHEIDAHRVAVLLDRGEAVERVSAAGAETHDARELAEAVVDEELEDVPHESTISLSPAPGGTMGNTFSSGSTATSITTTPGVE